MRKILKIGFIATAVTEFVITAVMVVLAINFRFVKSGHIDQVRSGSFTFANGLLMLLLIPMLRSVLKSFHSYYNDRATAIASILHFQHAGFLYWFQETPDLTNETPTPKNDIKINHQPVITIENLGFWYPAQPLLFRGLTLQVSPGEKLIITGNSGCGKSTLIALILGFLTPVYGSVKLDNRPTEQLSEHEISERISWVGQQAKVFQGTLRSNLLTFSQANDQTILNVIANYFDPETFFTPFAQGLDTIIAGSGRSLSGRDRQKIALLRAVLRDSPILLFDEPFTNLDSTSARQFMNGLMENGQAKTIILILQEDKPEFNKFKTIKINEGVEEYINVL